jgi:hypothetical protein
MWSFSNTFIIGLNILASKRALNSNKQAMDPQVNASQEQPSPSSSSKDTRPEVTDTQTTTGNFELDPDNPVGASPDDQGTNSNQLAPLDTNITQASDVTIVVNTASITTQDSGDEDDQQLDKRLLHQDHIINPVPLKQVNQGSNSNDGEQAR